MLLRIDAGRLERNALRSCAWCNRDTAPRRTLISARVESSLTCRRVVRLRAIPPCAFFSLVSDELIWRPATTNGKKKSTRQFPPDSTAHPPILVLRPWIFQDQTSASEMSWSITKRTRREYTSNSDFSSHHREHHSLLSFHICHWVHTGFHVKRQPNQQFLSGPGVAQRTAALARVRGPPTTS
jgi:hypothetical protein